MVIGIVVGAVSGIALVYFVLAYNGFIVLKNGIERGESLENAMNIAVYSGYNPREVQDASKFVGRGAINALQINPQERLTMPEKKKLFKKSSLKQKEMFR